MSDIITTVKGMAANLSTSSEEDFTMDEVFKRVEMFLKGKLVKNGCRLITDNRLSENTVIQGDINNLVQVVNNLLVPHSGNTLSLNLPTISRPRLWLYRGM